MGILKHLFLTKRKQPRQKKWVATAVGYVPWGDGAAEYFYNLYEYEMAQESVKGLMVASITPYQKMQILAPKRK
ncbi:Uncharacterised protein [Candidatus Bartonella washoeensis]|nr:Uncharacterised protein [Bartonella washoeensis]